jgi:hypothetical protein
MAASSRQPWLRAVILVGVVYFLIGRGFARPSEHIHAWRLAAWFVSGVVYAAHIWYEHFRLRNSPRVMASHVALAVAIGAMALAAAGMIHSLSIRAAIRPVWLLALVAWPVMTALPAFLVALVAGAVLPKLTIRENAE